MKKHRIIEEIIFKIIMISSLLITFAALFSILGAVVIKGFPSLNFDMITKTPQGGFYLGKEGGILNAIIGSLLIAGGSIFLSLFFALPIALFMNIYQKKDSAFSGFLRVSLDILNGVPSIVLGAFALIIMQSLHLRMSLLAGIITVAVLVLPIMTRGIDEVIKGIPRELLETGFALGSTKYELSLKIIIRQCTSGIFTAILLAFGRGIGDAASVMFTAGFSDNIPGSLLQPVATLPLAIFFQLSSPIKEVQDRAYAAAFILTAIILIISVFSRMISKQINKYKVK